MDKQNLTGVSSAHSQYTAILEHGIKVKEEIQSNIFELVGTLRRRELELCRDVDRACLQHIRENKSGEDNKLWFSGDIKPLKYALEHYGYVQCLADNEISNTFTHHKEPAFVKDFLVKVLSEELEEKASTASADSFEVIEPGLPEEKEDLTDKVWPWQEKSEATGMSEWLAAPSARQSSKAPSNPSSLNPSPSSNNPATALLAGFAPYLQKDDSRLWVKRETTEERRMCYEEWVAREQCATRPHGIVALTRQLSSLAV